MKQECAPSVESIRWSTLGELKLKMEFFVISGHAIEFRADGIVSLRLELFSSDRHLE